jgi:hypothetical protein
MIKEEIIYLMKLLLVFAILILSNCKSSLYGSWKIVDVSFARSFSVSPLENSVLKEKALENIYGASIKIREDSIIIIVQGDVIYRGAIDKITAKSILVVENGELVTLKYSQQDKQYRYLLEQPDGTQLIVERE